MARCQQTRFLSKFVKTLLFHGLDSDIIKAFISVGVRPQGNSVHLNVTHESGGVSFVGEDSYLLSPGCHIVKLHHLFSKLLEAVG